MHLYGGKKKILLISGIIVITGIILFFVLPPHPSQVQNTITPKLDAATQEPEAGTPEYFEILFEMLKDKTSAELLENEEEWALYRLSLREPISANKWLMKYLEQQDKSTTQLRLIRGNYTDFSPLLEFRELETLVLDNDLLTDISGITVLSQLEEMTSLSIGAKQVAAINPLSALVNLKKLSIYVPNTYTDASELLTLVNLESLGFRPTTPEIIQNIATLTGLTHLSLTFESEKVDISALQNLVNLQWLDLTQYSSTKPELDISALHNLANLKELYISGFSINDVSPLLNLPNLSEINIMFSEVSEENISLLEANIERVYSYKYKDH